MAAQTCAASPAAHPCDKDLSPGWPAADAAFINLRGRLEACRSGGGGRARRGSGFGRLAGMERLAGRILTRALGLKNAGMKDTVAPVRSFGQRLRVVLERVRRRLGALVDHFQKPARRGVGSVALKLVKDESDGGAVLDDGAGLDKSFDAKPAGVCLRTHAGELGDGDVVTFARAVARVGKPTNRTENDDCRKTDSPGGR